MKVKITHHQTSLKINNKNIEKQVKIILKEENVVTDEIILNFVDEKTMKGLHLKYFNDSSITDCISFPIDLPVHKKTGCHLLGEAFICPKQAIACCKTYKTSPYEELSLYVIHCVLHLIGYDDIKQKDKSIMRKKEKSYLMLFKKKKII